MRVVRWIFVNINTRTQTHAYTYGYKHVFVCGYCVNTYDLFGIKNILGTPNSIRTWDISHKQLHICEK